MLVVAMGSSLGALAGVVPGIVHGSGLLQDPSLHDFVWSFIAAHTR